LAVLELSSIPGCVTLRSESRYKAASDWCSRRVC
jgi:hypothetical protein